jgi:hypothetical protein
MTAALRLLGEGEVVGDPIILNAEDRDPLVGIDLEEMLLADLEVEGLGIRVLLINEVCCTGEGEIGRSLRLPSSAQGALLRRAGRVLLLVHRLSRYLIKLTLR